MRQHGHCRRKSALLMHPAAEEAGRDECINRSLAFLQQPRISPQLRRPAELQRAAQAFGFVADALVVLPQHMHRANQPMFVRGVELDVIAVVRLQPQHARAEQRDIVIVNDVELLAVEDLENLAGLRPWVSRLLRDQRRQDPQPAAQAVHGDVGMVNERRLRLAFRQRPVAIDAMNDIDFVTPPRQRVRQPRDKDGVAAEAIRRIEDREEAELKRPRHAAAPRRRPKAAGAPNSSTTAGLPPPTPPAPCEGAARHH